MIDSNSFYQPPKRLQTQIRLAFLLGLGSLLMLAVTVVLGILIESVGMVSYFGYVAVLAVAAIVLGVLARQKADPGHAKSKLALAGLVLGSIALFLMVAFRVAVFLLFIPMLGR